MDLDHLVVFEPRQAAGPSLFADFDARSCDSEVDGVKTNDPATAIELNLVTDFSLKHAAARRIDFEPDEDTARANPWVETAMCFASHRMGKIGVRGGERESQ
jgi:hypothetical protein